MIYCVTGLPRCGTSLMMRMLQAGGIEPYYAKEDALATLLLEAKEHERLPGDWEWLNDCQGKAVKILLPCIRKPPKCFEYKFIWMDRDLKEHTKSMNKFTRLMKNQRAEHKSKVMKKSKLFKRDSLAVLKTYENSDLLRVKFEYLIKYPLGAAEAVRQFLGRDLDVKAMANVVVKRSTRCEPSMLEVELYGKQA